MEEQSKGLLAKKDLVVIGFVTLTTVFVWMGFEVYRANSKDTVSEKTQQLIAPIDPTIREDVLNRLEASQP